jgi:hypothetical protein
MQFQHGHKSELTATTDLTAHMSNRTSGHRQMAFAPTTTATQETTTQIPGALMGAAMAAAMALEATNTTEAMAIEKLADSGCRGQEQQRLGVWRWGDTELRPWDFRKSR